MADPVTVPNDVSVADFMNAVTPQRRHNDALELDAIFQRVTGWKPKMWGPSIIGYGQYHYVYDSGREGDFLATGFSPRKANLSLYIMPGYLDLQPQLDRLGKHKIGKSCLYINKLADIDLDVLVEIITAGLKDLDEKWPVQPS